MLVLCSFECIFAIFLPYCDNQNEFLGSLKHIWRVPAAGLGDTHRMFVDIRSVLEDTRSVFEGYQRRAWRVLAACMETTCNVGSRSVFRKSLQCAPLGPRSVFWGYPQQSSKVVFRETHQISRVDATGFPGCMRQFLEQ